jgi:CheY-like chemotaxis protein
VNNEEKLILVVDDNPANLKLVCDVLEFEAYHVLKAADAEVAAEIIRRVLPDLILMDIALPGMDGLTMTRMLKADERTRHVVVVALTAFAMKGDEEKARDAGCDGYITKPIDTRTFVSTLQPFLPGSPDRSPALAATVQRSMNNKKTKKGNCHESPYCR